MDFRLLQPLKAKLPIVDKLLGRSNDDKAVQPLNVLSFTTVTPLGIFTDFRLEQLRKAP